MPKGLLILYHHGSVERREHLKTIQALDQDARRQLREAGVQFGFYNVYMPDMLKPKPARLLGLLHAYGAGGDKKPFIPFAGVTSIANEGDLKSDNFSERSVAIAGYRAVGPRIVRLDILNRLSLMIRDAQGVFSNIKDVDTRGRPFQIMQEMLSLLGGTHEDTRQVLDALGYKSETRDTLPDLPKVEEEKAEETPKPETASADSPSEGEATKSASENSEAETTPRPNAETPAPVAITSPTPTPAPKKAKKQKTLQLYNNRIQNEDGTTTEIEDLSPKGTKAASGNRTSKSAIIIIAIITVPAALTHRQKGKPLSKTHLSRPLRP